MAQAVEDFQNLKEYREKILEGGFDSYCVGYKDGRDAIEKLYPNLDLNSIVPLGSEGRVVEDEAVLTQDGTPTALDVVQVPDSTPK